MSGATSCAAGIVTDMIVGSDVWLGGRFFISESENMRFGFSKTNLMERAITANSERRLTKLKQSQNVFFLFFSFFWVNATSTQSGNLSFGQQAGDHHRCGEDEKYDKQGFHVFA